MLGPSLVSSVPTSSSSPLAMVLGALVAVVLLVVALGLAALVVSFVARRWLARAASRTAPAAPTSSDGAPAAHPPVPVLVSARSVDLEAAVEERAQLDPTGLLLVAQPDDVLPSPAQLLEAARELGRPDIGYVTFTDDDTDGSRVRAARRLVLGAPGPVALRTEALLDVGGWDGSAVLPETELSARMLRLGWNGRSLGAAPDSACDPQARERQVAWAVVRRHPGMLLPGRRHADNELSSRERLVLLATVAAALTAAPTPAERAWLAARLRPGAGGLRLPGAIPAAGVAVAVAAAGGLVAVIGATWSSHPPADSAAASAAGALTPATSESTSLVGEHLQPLTRPALSRSADRADAARTTRRAAAAQRRATTQRHAAAQRRTTARGHATTPHRTAAKPVARAGGVGRTVLSRVRSVTHRVTTSLPRTRTSAAPRTPAPTAVRPAPAPRPAKPAPRPSRPAAKPVKSAEPAKPVKATDPAGPGRSAGRGR
ncbi:hypothetical protein GCM10027596_27940 [Nocardioides korecus]